MQWSSNFTAIFDGNYKFLPSIDLESFMDNFEMEGVSRNPRNPPKTAPESGDQASVMICSFEHRQIAS